MSKIPSHDDYDMLVAEDFILKNQQGQPIVLYKHIDVDFGILDSMTRRVAKTGRRDLADGELDYYYDLVNPYVNEYFPGRPLFDKLYYSINVDIGYHVDSIPSQKSLTCTLCSRYNTGGGYIVLPDLKTAFAQQDGYICMFDGRKYKHGVTSIHKQSPDAYRTVYVFYT